LSAATRGQAFSLNPSAGAATGALAKPTEYGRGSDWADACRRRYRFSRS